MKTNIWKRMAAALLAGVMLIGNAGCGKEGNKTPAAGEEAISSTEQTGAESAKGRYMETMKTTPKGVSSISGMVRLADGSIAFIDENSGIMYRSKDNADSWEEREISPLSENCGIEELDITSRAIAPDGGVFYSYVDWREDFNAEDSSVREHYFYVDKDGNAEEITLKAEDENFRFYLSRAAFIGEKELIAHVNGGNVYKIDLETNTVSSIGVSDMMETGVFLAGDYLLSSEQIYQISTQSTVEDSVCTEFIREETDGLDMLASCFEREENTIYLASESGLYSHVIGGSTMEKLLDGGLCALGDPTKKATSVLKNEDGSFLIAYDDGEIDWYTYDKDASAVPTQQISIYSLEQNTTVSRAISMFRKSHPDVYVKQEIGLSGDYGMTKEDAVRNLNTSLLAGEGPDLLLLDELPRDSYIEKGILADLSETAEQMEKDGAFLSNILKAYQTEDGMYAMPVRFRIPVLIKEKGNGDRVEHMEDLAQAVKNAREAHPNGNTVLGTYTAEELLKRLYEAVSSDLTNEEGPDREAIRNFLNYADEIYEEEQKNITPELMEMHNQTLTWMNEYGMLAQYENLTIDSSTAMDFMSGNQSMMIAKLSGMDDFQMVESLPKNKDTLTYSFLGGASGGIFSPSGIIGVNEKSKEKELALSFLQELFGEAVQKSDLSDGFPVNADAWESFAKNPNPNSQLGFSASVAGEDGGVEERVNFGIEWPTEEEISALKEEAEKLVQPSLSDRVIASAVIESGIKVLEGSLAIDEGCDEIVQKVELYLAE